MTIPPVLQPVSPLRRRMLEDMAMRGLREETQRGYIRFMQSFAYGGRNAHPGAPRSSAGPNLRSPCGSGSRRPLRMT